MADETPEQHDPEPSGHLRMMTKRRSSTDGRTSPDIITGLLTRRR
jgi:hypothetical protein